MSTTKWTPFEGWDGGHASAHRSPWTLRRAGYDPVIEREVESQFAIGNGFLGVRGSLELPTLASRPRTFVAGLFDLTHNTSEQAFLAPAPDWLRLGIAIDGEDIELDGEDPSHVRTLDMRSGILQTDWTHRTPSGQGLHVATFRLASLARRSIALQVARITTDEHTKVTLEALLVPTTLSLMLEGIEGQLSYWRTAESKLGLIIAMKPQLLVDGRTIEPEEDGNRLARRWTWDAQPGRPGTFVRNSVFLTYGARDDRIRKSRRAAADVSLGHDDVVRDHVAAWTDRWARSDVRIEGAEEDQRALRYAAYQLISAANPDNEHTSIGARGLTGDAYSGHVFWDTEIFLLPFFAFTWPEAARALLLYRHHTLPAARAKAARLGYRGALYAWESADDGDEATPESAQLPNGETVPVLCGKMEHHISADIAFAVWQYWQATADDEFLFSAGAEIMLETARFWSSRASLESDGAYHIRHVIGPDEYHEDVDDNAYTNGMAQWNIETALVVADLLRTRRAERWMELGETIHLTDDELAHWRDVARGMYIGLDLSTGVIEQFRGYAGLEPIDLATFEPRRAAIDILLGRERTQRSQVIKQADVVMLISLLWDRFEPKDREVNFRYYESRCGHGSSLSPGVHALVAARLGDVNLAHRYFREAASIDLDDSTGTTSGGIHMAALGGLWQTCVFGFAGMSCSGAGIRFEPHLPHSWKSLAFPIRYRGASITVELDRERSALTVRLGEAAGPVKIESNGDARLLRSGEEATWPLRWSPEEAPR